MAESFKFASKCSVAGKGCRYDIVYICMHCGRPLCDGPYCHIKIKEPVFRKLPKDVDKVGIHCPDCAKKLHPFYFIFKPFRMLGMSIQKGWKEKTGRLVKKESAEVETEEEPASGTKEETSSNLEEHKSESNHGRSV